MTHAGTVRLKAKIGGFERVPHMPNRVPTSLQAVADRSSDMVRLLKHPKKRQVDPPYGCPRPRRPIFRFDCSDSQSLGCWLGALMSGHGTAKTAQAVGYLSQLTLVIN